MIAATLFSLSVHALVCAGVVWLLSSRDEAGRVR